MSVTVSVTIAVLIFASYEGMVSQLTGAAILNNLGNFQIRERSFALSKDPTTPVAEYVDLKSKLKGVSRITGLSRQVVLPGFVSSTEGSQAIDLVGVDGNEINSVIPLKTSISEGTADGTVIGKGLAKKLNLSVGDNLVINFQDIEGELRTEVLPISGIFDFSSKKFQKSFVFTRIEDVEMLAGFKGIHRFVIKGDSLTFKDLAPLVPDKMILTHWSELNPEIALTINFQKGVIYFFLIILGFGISLTILTPISMVLNERIPEFRMMSVLGISKPKIFVLNLNEATILSLISLVSSIILSSLIVIFLSHSGVHLATSAGAIIERGGIILPNVIYPAIKSEQMVISIVFTLLTVYLSYLFATWKILKHVRKI